MKITDTRNGTEYDVNDLPNYGKHDFLEADSPYGYITLTQDLKVMYFYSDGLNEASNCDVTKHFTFEAPPANSITEKDLQEIWKHSDGGEYQAIRAALIEKGVVTKPDGGTFWNFSYKFQVDTDKLDDLRRIARLLHENNLFEMKITGNFGGDSMKMIEARFQHLNFLSELRLYCAHLDINGNAEQTIKRLRSYSKEELGKIEL
jgi:hypothetical protein